MKRALLLVVAVVILSATGCAGRQCSCGNEGHGPGPLRPRGWAVNHDRGAGMLAGHGNRHGDPEEGMVGPSSAAVGYPYYTVRGPRDFLVNNPPSIGR
jgi:hypothetical protein